MLKMRTILLSAAAVTVLTGSALAQPTSALYFTCREYAAPGTNAFRTNGTLGAQNNDIGNQTFYPGAIGNPILPANNPVLYLSPRMPGAKHVRGTAGVVVDRDTSLRPLQLWLSVGEKYIGVNSEEVMSSLGFDISSTAVPTSGPVGAAIPVPTANRRGVVAYTLTMLTTPAATNGVTALWDGVNIITNPMTDVRAVTVPDSVGDFANGAPPTTSAGNAGLLGGSYRVGELMVQADGPATSPGSLGCKNQLPTQYDLKFAVGNLLITRALNPAYVPGTPISAENVGFGYSAGTPEAAVGGACGAVPCGSTATTSSATADASIVLRFKGDLAGALATQAPQGNVNAIDLNALLNVLGPGLATATPLQKWLCDFGGALATQPPQGTLNAIDLNIMLNEVTYFGTLATCP